MEPFKVTEVEWSQDKVKKKGRVMWRRAWRCCRPILITACYFFTFSRYFLLVALLMYSCLVIFDWYSCVSFICVILYTSYWKFAFNVNILFEVLSLPPCFNDIVAAMTLKFVLSANALGIKHTIECFITYDVIFLPFGRYIGFTPFFMFLLFGIYIAWYLPLSLSVRQSPVSR